MDEADVEERLQSLEHTHGFVTLLEDEELPDHTLTLKYRFVHVLYQNALYGSLTPSRKAAFSASIAEALLAFHGERSSAVASELAFLFETARDWQRAAEHFLTAARNAARIFANQEAISLCRRGLDVNRRTANTPDRARQELRLQMTLGFCLMTVKGFAATDTLRTFLRAEELCRELGDETQLFRVLFGLSIVSVVRAEYVKGRKFADACLQHARQHDDGLQLVQAHWVLGLNLQLTGDFAGSREHFEQSIARYEPRRHAAHAFLYGGILNRLHLARVLLYLGHPEQADARMKEGLHVAETLRHPVGLVNSLSVAITIEAYHRNTASILAMADRILFHADEHGLPYYAGIATIMRGWARAMQGEVDDGCAEMRAGLAAHRGLETEQQRAYYLVLMGEALCAARRTDEALDALDEAADLVRACEEHFCEAELHRVRGEVLTLAQRRDDALTSFRRSIEIARTQGASGLELRAAMSFARAASEPACRDEAIAALRAAYDRFAEGFETTDLQAARAFL
jgi:predicted ATPase